MYTFEITFGTSATQKHWPQPEMVDLEGLEAACTTHVVRDKKDGGCYVPGGFAGYERKAPSVNFIDLLVYDIDGGQSMDGPDGILTKLTEANIKCFVYTTYSHLVNKTEVNANHYETWAKKHNGVFPPKKAEHFAAYFEHKKKLHLTDLDYDVENNRSKHFVHDKDGMKYVVYHSPVEKFRVVFPLKARLALGELGESSNLAIQGYKSIYHGVGEALGLQYDPACEDPSRLYYWPSFAPGKEHEAQAWSIGDENAELLSPHDYPRAAVRETKSYAKEHGEPLIVTDSQGVQIHLGKWWHDNKQHDIEGTLQNCLPDDMIKASRKNGDGFHIECPFEAHHSTVGGKGTFAANGDGDHPWTIHCMHASCKDAGHGKLDYLAEYISQGLITAADLHATALGAEASVLHPSDMAEALTQGEDPSHVIDALAKHESNPLSDDTVLRKIVEKSGRKDRTVYMQTLKQALKKSRNERAHSVKMKSKAAARSSTELPLSATLQLKTMLENAGVEGEILENGRALLFQHDGRYYTVRNARLLGHREIVEPHCDPLQKFSSLLGDTALLHIDNETLSDYFPSLCNDEATDHDVKREVEQIPPDDLARPNLDLLVPIMDHLGHPELAEVFRLNAEYALVSVGGEPRAYTRKTGLRHSVGALEVTDCRQAVLALRGMTKAKLLGLIQVWLNSLYKVQYDGVGLYPLGLTTKGTSYLDDPSAQRHFNLWDGFAVEPRPGSWDLFKAHMLNILCEGNETYYGFLLKWMAHRVQKPWQIPGVAIVLFGKKGCGKTLFASLFADLFGKHADVIDKPQHVVGQFSDFAEEKLLVVLEEALFSKDPRHVNATKHMITSTKQKVEKKYEQARSVNTSPGFIFCSNSEKPVHVTPDERRFFALGVPGSRIGDKAYFQAILAEMNGGGLEAMLYELQRLDISDFEPMAAMPYTKHLSAMVLASLEGEDRALLNALKSGQLGDNRWPEDTPLVIDTKSACEAFKAHSTRRYEEHGDLTSLGRYLEECGLVRRKIKPEVNGNRCPAFELAGLRRAREIMAAHWRVGIDALQFGAYDAETSSEDMAREYLRKAIDLAGISPASEHYRALTQAIGASPSNKTDIPAGRRKSTAPNETQSVGDGETANLH